MARSPLRFVSISKTNAREITRTRPVRTAGLSQETSASPRALIGQPNPEQSPQELHGGLPSKRFELTAAGCG